MTVPGRGTGFRRRYSRAAERDALQQGDVGRDGDQEGRGVQGVWWGV